MFSGEFKVAVVKEVFKEGQNGTDYKHLHDVLVQVFGTALSEAEVHLEFFKLPEDLQCDALKWGLSDTEVRDNIYTHLMKR